MKKIVFPLAIASMMLAMQSCGEKDYFDPSVVESNLKAEYATSFKKTFRNTSLNQSWDFSKSITPYREFSTRAAGGSLDVVSGVQLPADAANSLLKAMPEGKDHSAMGSQFTIVSKGEFIVCPVWHGACKAYTLVIKAYDPLTDNTLSYEMTAEDVRKTMNYDKVKNPTQWIETNMTKNAPMGWILPFPKGTIVNFYLVDAGADCNDEAELAKSKAIAMGHEQESWKHRHEYSDFILLDDSGADKDFNDLVLAVYTKEGATTEEGEEQEDPEIVVDKKTIEVDEIVAEKRYMVEDLGSVGDFDFNDLVVDVRNYRKGTLEFEDGVLVGNNVTDAQKAIVRAMGGEFDLIFKVGDTAWMKSTKHMPGVMYNTQEGFDEEAVLDEFDVTGWNPAENNVSLTVLNTNAVKSADIVYTIQFPKAGEVPMIIAKDKDTKWSSEQKCVPESWFTE